MSFEEHDAYPPDPGQCGSKMLRLLDRHLVSEKAKLVLVT